MVTHIKNARVFFDNKLIGNAHASADQAVMLDTEAFSSDEFNADTSLRLYPARFSTTVSFDLEASAQFDNWAGVVKRQATLDMIRKMAGRFQPFTFGPPMYYHGDMLANSDTRRVVFMRPSNVGKTTAMVINGDATYGKLSQHVDGTLYSSATWLALMHDMITKPDEVRIDGKWHRANPHFPTPTFESINRAILRLKVRDICANWGAYK